ncbi:phage tail tape measure protein [Aeribacillus composti]|uniref:phage tail tape measure protein n=1 Tax=Aeribacillus composti TaxID=1868734 RepID=UPI003D190CA1
MAEYDLGKYGATIELDDSQFEKAMSNAENKIDSTDKKSKLFGKNLGALATGALAGLGTALVGAGVAGIKMASDIDGSLKQLQAQTGATDNEMKSMEQSLKNIYSQGYGESFADVADAMALVKQNTGLAGKELEKTTQNAIALRDTFGLDVAETTNAANSLMKQFGITADQAYNLIAQGAQNGANKNGDMLDTLNEYAPQFKALGFSAEEFTNVLIDGAKNGQFSIDKVADAMKEFNIRAKDGSKTTIDAFQSLGLNANDMMSKFAAGGDSAQQAFTQVMTALNNVKDPLEKNRIGVQLFGTMFEDLEASGISALANIGNTASLSKDALGQINQVKYDTLGSALQGIWRSLQMALITPIQQHVLPLLNQFATWIQSNMPTIQTIISTVFSAIGTVFSVFINVVQSVIGTFSGFYSNTNTIFSGIKTIIETAMSTIQTIIQTVLTVITNLWNTYGSTIVSFLTSTFLNVQTIIQGALNVVQGIFKTVLSILTGDWKGAWNGIQKILDGVLKIIIGVVKQVFNSIKLVINTILNTIKGIFSGIWNSIKSLVVTVVTSIYNSISSKFKSVRSFISNLLSSVKSIFSNIWNSIRSTVVSLITGIYNSISSKFNSVKSFISVILSSIKSVFSNIWNSIRSTVFSVTSSIYSNTVGRFNSLRSSMSSIFSGILSKARSIFNSVKSAITSPINSAKSIVMGIINSIRSAFSRLKISIPKPKLPHINVNWRKFGVGDLSVKIPTFSLRWYKTGGFFDQPSIVGLGEDGREAILPLENKRYMAPFADAVFERLRDRMLNKSVHNSTNNHQNIINNTFHFDVKHKIDDSEMNKIAKYVIKKQTNGLKGAGVRMPIR